MRRSRHQLSVLTMLCLCLAGGAHAQTKAGDQLTVAGSFSNIYMAPVWLAQDGGLFQAEGLNVRLVYIASGTLATQSLVSGDVDLGVISGGAVMSAMLAGYPLKIIAGMINYYPNSFFSTPEIQAPQQLRDKKIAVTRVGSASHIATVALLERWGLKEGQYTILQLGSTQARLVALKTGQIQGTTLSAPESVLAKEAGLKILAPFQEIRRLGVVILHVAIVGSADTLKKKVSAVERFLRAVSEGIHVMYTQKEKTIQSLRRHTGLTEAKFLDETYADHVVLDSVPFPKDEALQATLDLLARSNPKAHGAHPGDFVDLGFLRKMEQEGLFRRLWGSGR